MSNDAMREVVAVELWNIANNAGFEAFRDAVVRALAAPAQSEAKPVGYVCDFDPADRGTNTLYRMSSGEAIPAGCTPMFVGAAPSAAPAQPKHCQTGYADVCHAAAEDGVTCPDDSCDIDDCVRAAPAGDAALPPLPWPAMPRGGHDYFSTGQMQDYARAALAARHAPTGADAPAVDGAMGATKGGFFVCDPENSRPEFYDTDAERAKAHDDAIKEYRTEALLDSEWSLDVEYVISGIVTHRTAEVDLNGGSDYVAQPLRTIAAAGADAEKP